MQHIVERMTIHDGEVEAIDVRLEARQFLDVMAVAPRTDSSSQQQRSVLDYYLEVG